MYIIYNKFKGEMALKKYCVLIIVTVALIFGSSFIPDIIASGLPKTQVTKIQEVDYTEYVSASGEVTQTNKKYIVTDFPMIVGDVLIKSGDTVKKGQTLLRVDREATVKGRKVTYGGYAIYDGAPRNGAFAYGQFTEASV